MISINTNLSSLIAQQSLKQSSNKLNLAVERMSTGFKINHAKDNAANYSISTNMTTKIGAYQVAEDNVAMGLDLLSTANGSLDQISDKLSRLRALAEQSANGTYGAQSRSAINAEANALVDEIERLYNTTEYNGQKLFTDLEYKIFDYLPLAKDEYRGFISNPITYSDAELATFIPISDVESLSPMENYTINNIEELEKFAKLVNKNEDTYGSTFVLTTDIDLSGKEWNPIGGYQEGVNVQFNGKFDGNGHVIKNLTIESSELGTAGFWASTSSSASIKNLGLENVNIDVRGYRSEYNSTTTVGCLIGNSQGVLVSNCFVINGNVIGEDGVGGLIGAQVNFNSEVSDCYFKGSVFGEEKVGGLIGSTVTGPPYSLEVKNCFTDAYISGLDNVGGLIGLNSPADIINCYAKGEVIGKSFVGGLVGKIGTWNGKVYTNNVSYAEVFTEDKLSSGSLCGGMLGTSDGINYNLPNITNCIARNLDIDLIGGMYYNHGSYIPDYDKTSLLSNIYGININSPKYVLQVGINFGSENSITVDSAFASKLISLFRGIGYGSSENILNSMDLFMDKISSKAVEFGAAQNRLESALDEISTQYENLVSSRSTLRDADISEVSSEYIRQQILQEASATLMATANQSASIALSLI